MVLFDGFMKVYEEGRDDVVVDDDDRMLPQIMQGEATDKRTVTPEQHFTQPPPRYTEATLVKKMEEIGIGRPSTYASVVTTIQDRGYVRKEKNRLFPEDKGRLVTVFLINYFRRYVGYDFTAKLENELDDITSGELDWQDVLGRFWRDFKAAIEETSDLRITEVLDKINEVLEPHLFPPNEDGTDPRLCPNCGAGQLSMRTARSGGAFIGCSNYPECRYTRAFGPPGTEPESGIPPEGKLLGQDEGDNIWVHKGRFGPYAQRGEVSDDNKKPPRQGVPEAWDPAELTLEQAVKLLALPRLIGHHPEDGVAIWANVGRYGPLPETRRVDLVQGRHQCQPGNRRRRLGSRHEPRRPVDRRKEGVARTRTPGQDSEGSGRTPRPRRGRGDHGRQVRALREMGKGERHHPGHDETRRRHDGNGRAAYRRTRGQGGQEAPAPQESLVKRRLFLAATAALGALGLGAFWWPRRWRYIVVHHSGGQIGDLELLKRVHRERQPRDPVDMIPYHFVIGNGRGMEIGQVAETERWKNTIWGAHVKSPDPQLSRHRRLPDRQLPDRRTAPGAISGACFPGA